MMRLYDRCARLPYKAEISDVRLVSQPKGRQLRSNASDTETTKEVFENAKIEPLQISERWH